ncbi:MAG: hypothetical protein ACI9JL_002574 [Paracoccaceae bacterium]|jgi:hypothetical protein
MVLQRLLASLFARPAPPSFTPDIPGVEAEILAAEMQACLNRSGGALATIRRTAALAGLFGGLSAVGKQQYVDALKSLDAAGGKSAADRYSEIEEAELFGRSSSKLSMLDAFETPVRRMLAALNGTTNGPALIAEIREISDDDLKNQMDNL